MRDLEFLIYCQPGFRFTYLHDFLMVFGSVNTPFDIVHIGYLPQSQDGSFNEKWLFVIINIPESGVLVIDVHQWLHTLPQSRKLKWPSFLLLLLIVKGGGRCR